MEINIFKITAATILSIGVAAAIPSAALAAAGDQHGVGTTTLYLAAIQHSMTYHANGGLGSDIQDIAVRGTDYVIRDNAGQNGDPSYGMIGMHFLGWNTEPDGSGDWYEPGDTFLPTENLEFYAQWELDAVMTGVTQSKLPYDIAAGFASAGAALAVGGTCRALNRKGNKLWKSGSKTN